MADLSKQCRRAFYDGRKEDALRLLAEVEQPHPDLIHYSAEWGWLDVCRQLVENYNLNPSNRATIHFGGMFMKFPRPLHVACAHGRVEVVKYLLTLPLSCSLSMRVMVVVFVGVPLSGHVG